MVYFNYKYCSLIPVVLVFYYSIQLSIILYLYIFYNRHALNIKFNIFILTLIGNINQ